MTDPEFDPLNYGQVSLKKDGADEAPGAEDVLFADGPELSAASSFGAEQAPAFQDQVEAPMVSDDGWDPVDDSMAPELAMPPLPSREPGLEGVGAVGGGPTQDLSEQMQDAAPTRRNLLPAADPVGATAAEAGTEPMLRAGTEMPEPPLESRPTRREALPTASDAPRVAVSRPTAGTSAWLLPLLVFVLGAGAGGLLIATDTNLIVGAIAAGLGVVGAPLVRGDILNLLIKY